MIAFGALAKAALAFIFDTAIGKAAAAAVGLAFLFSAWLWQHDNKVQSRVIAQINQKTERLTNDAIKARDDASRPGAVERLRKGSCSDC